jgi:2-polyprenyl-6-methoxyphenol hydroxylase-like FAD-dependent oxidoreductase
MRQRGSTHDVVVVGARCAGSATAMLLARQGYDVVVIDRARLPGDTVSTLSIARGGVVQLSRWGLLDSVLDSGAPPIRLVTFRTGETEDIRTVKRRAGVDLLVAPRRYILDAILAQAAGAAGADLRTGLTATGVRRGPDGRVCAVIARDAAGAPVELSARFVVGADGVRSRVAREVGAEVIESHPADNATFYAFFAGVDWRGFEFHLGQGAFAGVFPTHGGEACVWLCCPAASAAPIAGAGGRRVEALVDLIGRASPSLAHRLRSARVASPVRGAVGLPNHVRRAAGPGWALVGDAGYHRDPITGHGITDAFRDAELLSGALDRSLRGGIDEREALAAYQRQRDGALRETFDLTCALARFPAPERFVALQKRLSRAIEAEAERLASVPAPTAAAMAVAA